MVNNEKKILIIAGEASGDLHAAELVAAVKNHMPNTYFYGLGGTKMQRQGVKLLWDLRETAVMGILDVIINIGKIYRILHTLRNILRKDPPDLLILVDYPGLNLHLAKIAKKNNVKVFYYISPQLWASREYRINIIKKCVNEIAVIFPFEVDYYRKFGIEAQFVGNPLTDVVKTTMTPSQTKLKFSLKNDCVIIGLCPGSRKGEIKKILPELIKTAEVLHNKIDHVQFVIPLASSMHKKDMLPYLKNTTAPIIITDENNYDVMNACELIIAASGTVTLEIALLNVPLVIVYRIFPLWLPIEKFIKIKMIGLCNIMAGKKVAKELLQKHANSEEISKEALKILSDEAYRNTIKVEFSKIREKFTSSKQTKIDKLIISLF